MATDPSHRSVTTWTRLEPQTRSADLREGATARIADPAWLLARQWQFGEFQASDGGSPAVARLRLRAGVLSGYQGRGTGDDADRWIPYAQQALPLEVLVEREPASEADLRLRADGGRRFLRLLERHGAGHYREGYTRAYALASGAGGAVEDPEAAATLAVLAGRVPDAEPLAAALASIAAEPPELPPTPPVAAEDRPLVLAAASEWLTWWQALVDRAPEDVQAWDAHRMEHSFALGARLGAENSEEVTLVAREYPGGSLDWYDLDVAADGTSVPAAQSGDDLVRTVIPTPVSYPGMPASRFWEFENARVHLGGIEAGAADLGRMLLSEFAILYSDDWFVIPVELPVGTVARVASLVVTDTFSVRTLVEPAAHGDWDMFRLAGGGAEDALFVLPPTLAHDLEGPPVEEVLLLRDENANVVWGVEKLVEGAAGAAVDRHERFLAALRAEADQPGPVRAWPPDPPGDLAYRLRKGVPPEHWIPLIPEADPAGLRLRRAALPRDDGGDPILPLGRLLGQTDWLASEEVPRDGVRVVRQWQLARGGDGATHLWRTRRKLAGRGEATTGFRYDALARPGDEPAPEAAPTIAGVAQAGQQLTAVTRTWAGPPPVQFVYQWRRCDAAGESCRDIAGAVEAAYTPTNDDVGATIRVAVTANGASSSVSAVSAPTAPVAPPLTPPASVAPPAIAGRARVGEELVVTPGTWSANPPAAVARQWRRCDATGANCVDVAGATGAAYRLIPLDQGGTMRVVETATNSAGHAQAESEPSATVAPPPAPPLLAVPPSIFGAPEVGRTLEADSGMWTGAEPIALTHQWQRCDATGETCTDIAGATSAAYPVAIDDAGSRLRVVVTASNEAGSAQAASAATSAVPGPATPPVNVEPPSVGGTTVVGKGVVANTGTWSGTPPSSFTYRWQRCSAAGDSCRDIIGATSEVYLLKAADAGSTLRVIVRAINEAGSAHATSAASAVVLAPPVATALPAITGPAELGATLTTDSGRWSGSTPMSYDHQWLRCGSDGASCVEITGATGAAYTVAAADLGATIRVRVGATNGAGVRSATSDPTAAATVPTAPSNVVPPTLVGDALVGRQLSVEHGVWSGSAITGWSYQWERCAAGGGACTPIPGAVDKVYELAPADEGSSVRLQLTASNPVGASTAASPPSAVVRTQSPPENTALPTITGTPQVGWALTAEPGSWSGGPTALACQWLRCDADGKACEEIKGATDWTYWPQAGFESALPGWDTGGDVGSTLRVVVTAGNASGSTTATSEATPMIMADDALPEK